MLWGYIAQLGERLLYTQEVCGSLIPAQLHHLCSRLNKKYSEAVQRVSQVLLFKKSGSS